MTRAATTGTTGAPAGAGAAPADRGATSPADPGALHVGRQTLADEIAALQRLHDGLDERFVAAAAALAGIDGGKVLALGVGKSGLVAQKLAATLRSAGLPALYLSASDSLHGDLGVVGPRDAALLLSKSGATSELMTLVPHLRARGVTLIAITGTPGSPLARESDIVLDGSVEREGCPLDAAPMASALVASAIGDALAAAVMRARGFTAEDFARLHPAGALGARLTLSVADVMRQGEELPRVLEGASLKEAVLEITRTGYGAVCVLDPDGALAGFITDGDVRRQLLQIDDIAAVPVADVMSRAPLTVTPELPLSQALLLLEQRKKALMTAPVVADERCVGLLRLHDAVRAHLPS
ncbi:MAG: KpsF/GutQ family sugar-phosphate isomerase [Solirubrobacteraceae bacterium]|nr:KpsF/GutQ family sugar-phosphate isomerase [Solirubrobacteraceae bacterium]